MFTSDPSIIDGLAPCADEVDFIFTHPLEAVLDPELSRNENLVEKGSEDWHYETELYVRGFPPNLIYQTTVIFA
jgi:hypothetical protein